MYSKYVKPIFFTALVIIGQSTPISPFNEVHVPAHAQKPFFLEFTQEAVSSRPATDIPGRSCESDAEGLVSCIREQPREVNEESEGSSVGESQPEEWATDELNHEPVESADASHERPSHWCKSMADSEVVPLNRRFEGCYIHDFLVEQFRVVNGQRVLTGSRSYSHAMNVFYDTRTKTVDFYFGISFGPVVGDFRGASLEIRPELRTIDVKFAFDNEGRMRIPNVGRQPTGSWRWESKPSRLHPNMMSTGQQAFAFVRSEHQLLETGTIRTSTRDAAVRCDTVVKSQRYGCVDPRVAGIHTVTGGQVPDIYNHISQAHASGLPGVHFSHQIPFRTSSDKYLHRTLKLNLIRHHRYIACQRRDVPRPAPVGTSCDEYPFASTLEGATDGMQARSFTGCEMNDPVRSGPHGFSRCFVRANQNSLHGAMLGQDYMNNRILEGEEFMVVLMSPPR